VGVVMRIDDLDAALAALRESGVDAGRALAASRETAQGTLSWRIAVRDDGRLLFGGALPTLIEWGAHHPVPAMAPSRLRLRAVTLRGMPPAAASVLPMHAVSLDDTPGPALQAQIESPRGLVTLCSS
jgi:Glyoxalase-like domain